MEEPCPICLEHSDSYAMLECGHKVGLGCLLTMFQNNQHNCPLCRNTYFHRLPPINQVNENDRVNVRDVLDRIHENILSDEFENYFIHFLNFIEKILYNFFTCIVKVVEFFKLILCDELGSWALVLITLLTNYKLIPLKQV